MSIKPAWTFYIATLGCKVNQYESQAISESWQALGGKEVKLAQEAQVALVNSCAITAKGERDTRNALYTLSRENPNSLRILTGCAANLVASDLDNQDNYYNILVPPQKKALLMQGPWQWEGEEYPYIIPENISVNPFGSNGFSINSFKRTRPIIKVQDGCSHRCTYCIVPLVRGKSVSRAANDVLAEATRLLQSGFCEILLSGINLHHYGRDFNNDEPMDFWDLVSFLDDLLGLSFEGRARFRISSLEPSQINAKGLEVIKEAELLCPQLHLSLQHGSAKILKSMGRGHYKLDKLVDAIEDLRKFYPHLGLGADILMGFPGEDEQDVNDTLDIIKSLGLTYAHVFPYSKRPGTAASTFDNQVPKQLKLERAARVRELVDTQKTAFLNSLLAEPYLNVVVDSQGHDEIGDINKQYKGIDAHYAPCVLQLTEPKSINGIIRAKPVKVENNTIIVSA